MNLQQSPIYQETLRRVRDNVRASGWDIVTAVGPGMPEYAYTVGFQSAFRHPDLLVFGLSAAAAREGLTEAADRLRTERWALSDGDLVDVFTKRDGRAVRMCPKAFRSYLPVSTALYADRTQGVQLVLSDRKGLMPWQPFFSGQHLPILAVRH